MFLNLSIQEFPNLNADLPHDLVKLCMSNNSVKINWVTGSNTKTMRKVFPILQYLNDDDIIIYIDDDILYPSDYIKSRIEDFRKFNSPITGVDKWVVFKNCKPPIIGVVGATGLI